MRRLVPLALVGLCACQVFDPMMWQQKYKPYRGTTFFPDGVSMLAPPPGTVPSSGAIEPALATGIGPDGKLLPVAPVALSRDLVELGRRKFDQTCAICHGLTGDGDSMVAKNMALRPPPSIHLKRSFPDGYFYQVVTNGFGVMPSYAAELSVEERWAVVAYVRALQLSQNARIDQLPAEQRSKVQEEPR
ncbi:c-type cytochrome [Anaeromyxobacter paludicola]|uniref:Quinol:cytochrome C oxidoreductase n=1 Tax=Anaeromyxobacter paludicola TaxID=2918171 RepID=A0ABN6NBC2_9BACT|nr:cytochrome c [Anaeromyxobacter paludicola]BDG10520.1 quinol:cytochrome C oxidoreductase [Anaeromyxobacter paludicola]